MPMMVCPGQASAGRTSRRPETRKSSENAAYSAAGAAAFRLHSPTEMSIERILHRRGQAKRWWLVPSIFVVRALFAGSAPPTVVGSVVVSRDFMLIRLQVDLENSVHLATRLEVEQLQLYDLRRRVSTAFRCTFHCALPTLCPFGLWVRSAAMRPSCFKTKAHTKLLIRNSLRIERLISFDDWRSAL